MKRPVVELRVLQIVKGLDIGNIHGGAERFAVELARQQKKDAGLDISVCAFFEVGTESESKWTVRLASEGIPSFHVAPWTGNDDFRNYLTGIRRLQAHLAKIPVDICHSHFQLGTIGAIYLKAKNLTRRVVRTCHVTQEWDPGLYGWAREQIFSKWVFPLYVDAEVGVSQEIVDMISAYPVRWLKKREPVLIHNAVPGGAEYSGRADRVIERNRDGKIIGTVGRLSEVKGYRYLIESGPLIREAYPDAQIWMIGDGELRESLEQLAKSLGLADFVRFFGQREDVQTLIAQMDLLIMTSLREGLPTVVLESFSQGVPVVGTDVSGIRELVRPGETGWLVPPADVQALADTIIQALRSEEDREKFSQSARELAANFSIDHVADQYLNLYEQLLS